MKKINDSLHHFWKRWVHEYLVSLRESHKLRGLVADIKVGDVVVIHEEGVKRHKWKIGKVEKLIKGDDDIVRGAVLKYSKGNQEQTISQPYNYFILWRLVIDINYLKQRRGCLMINL